MTYVFKIAKNGCNKQETFHRNDNSPHGKSLSYAVI